MAKSSLPQCCRNSVPLFEGKKIDLFSVDGRELIIHPGAVVILPLLSGSEVVMIRNERFVVDETLWELPAGTLEPNEPPLSTARRSWLKKSVIGPQR